MGSVSSLKLSRSYLSCFQSVLSFCIDREFDPMGPQCFAFLANGE